MSAPGRKMSLMQATLGVSYGFGLLFVGAVGDAVNMHVAFGTAAVVAAGSFAALTLRARNWRRALDGTEQPSAAASFATA